MTTTPSQTVKDACQVLRRLVRFKDAHFRLPKSKPSNMVAAREDSAAIVEATELYTESWVVPIIDAIERGDTALLRHLCDGCRRDKLDPPDETYRLFLIEHDPAPGAGGPWSYSLPDYPGDGDSGRARTLAEARAKIDSIYDADGVCASCRGTGCTRPEGGKCYSCDGFGSGPMQTWIRRQARDREGRV